MPPVSVITGISGQDGSFLAEQILSDTIDSIVISMVRRTSANLFRERIEALECHPRVQLVYADMTDATSIRRLLDGAVALAGAIGWIDVYNLAAQSHVKISFETPLYTAETDAIGVLNMLETILHYPLVIRDRFRFYQASTSEMFGSSPSPQNENTPFNPCSPYGVAKLYAHWIVRTYRESYGIKACSGILFNHESTRRSNNFITKKVTQAVARYATNPNGAKPVAIGNLEARRDWGFAPDYVRAMRLMIENVSAENGFDPDFVISTGVSHTIRELVEIAFGVIGIAVHWEGSGLTELGFDAATRTVLVTIDKRYFRPTEVEDLLGDSSRARTQLGWQPTITFREMIREMVNDDISGYLENECKNTRA